MNLNRGGAALQEEENEVGRDHRAKQEEHMDHPHMIAYAKVFSAVWSSRYEV